MSDPGAPDYTPGLDWARMADPDAAEAERRGAYARLFRSALGRQVLRDFLEVCGVGERKLPLLGSGLLEHAAGMNDAALSLLELAGFNAGDLAANLTPTHDEQGHFDDRHDLDLDG